VSDSQRADGPILVTGAAGQLGQAIVETFRSTHQTVALTRRDLDVTRSDDVARVCREIGPAAIVNCVGYNNVDGAETEQETALAVNAFAVRALARAARACDAILVHYSSDFVFDGESDHPYEEDDLPAPRSVYAASKMLGEWFAADAPRHYVLRVESLFGGVARMSSSFDKIIDAIAAGGPVRVFVDRVVSPSYVFDVAEATRKLVQLQPPIGVYHCVNSGHATWAELAEVARRRVGVDARLEPVKLADVKLAAARPRYCALSNEKLRAAGIAMPAWQDALDRYLAARGLHAPSQRI
jgi:dTDP-4-dehydrorhamnose reductase